MQADRPMIQLLSYLVDMPVRSELSEVDFFLRGCWAPNSHGKWFSRTSASITLWLEAGSWKIVERRKDFRFWGTLPAANSSRETLAMLAGRLTVGGSLSTAVAG